MQGECHFSKRFNTNAYVTKRLVENEIARCQNEINDYFANVRKMLREYRYYYYERLSKEDQKLINLFARKKYDFITSMKKVFYPKMFRQGIVDEILLRFIFFVL